MANRKQASFKALNIESDEESDDEVDNTKEIQIEEALKLYQAALKYHSQEGTLDEAGKAYRELFDSDIFKLPEAQSEFERVANFQDQFEADTSYFNELQENNSSSQTIAESAPSSLPQILHLSHKNRGEYHLDFLQHLLNNGTLNAEKVRRRGTTERHQFSTNVLKALEDFAQALDKDEDDLDLWRRAARVCQMLGSQRAVRFCLEAALDGDEEGTDDILNLPNFELEMDEKELDALLYQIQDRLSILLQPPTNTSSGQIPKAIHEKLKLYPNLPSRSTSSKDPKNGFDDSSLHLTSLNVPEHSLDALGRAILDRLEAQEDNLQQPATAVRISLPPPSTDAETFGPDITEEQDRKQSHDSNSAGQSKDGRGQDSSVRDNQKPERSGSRRNTMVLPNRKRSMDTANLPDPPEGERARSKRIKARQSTAHDRGSGDTGSLGRITLHDSRIEVSIQADRWLFTLVGDLSQKIGVSRIAAADEIRRLVMPETPLHSAHNGADLHLRKSILDFYAAMQSWNKEKQRVLGKAVPPEEELVDKSDSGLNAFLDISNEPKNRKKTPPIQHGAQELTDTINAGWFTIEQVATMWVETLLSNGRNPICKSESTLPNLYLDRLWTEDLKQTLERIILLIDDQLFDYASRYPLLQKAIATPETDSDVVLKAKIAAIDFAETIFETQLDMYSRLTCSGTESNRQDQMLQKERMHNWCALARDFLGSLEVNIDLDELKAMDISLRHIWATVFSIHAAQDIPRDTVIAYIEDLKGVCENSFSKSLYLQNCATIPELSVQAADKEISKLETMDFFTSIFHKDDQHPVDIVEKLEPILLPPRLETDVDGSSTSLANGMRSAPDRSCNNIDDEQQGQGLSRRQFVLSEFVRRSSVSLRQALWYRLRTAYFSIDFPAKVLFVNLKVFELIISDLKSESYENADFEERESRLFQALRNFDDLMHKTHELLQSHVEAVSALDDESLKDFLGTLQELWGLLYTVALFDDYSQLMQKNPPLTNPFRTYPSESFHSTSIKLHELQILIIIVTYRVFQEAMARFPTKFSAPDEDKLEFLRYVHYSLGMRRICKASDNMLLKFMKDELQELSLAGRITSDDFAQILYDLYDLHLFSSPGQRQDHGCEPDYLDRSTADSLVDFVLERARAANMRDMPKLELGKTVEKIQNALGPVKSSLNTTRNRKIYNNFVKSPINPMDLFQSLKGIGYLSSVAVSPQEAPIASKRWYRLLAEINMAKYRKLRGNMSQEAEEDVQDAVSFIVHDLEYTMDDWESWYLLANANDALINESVTWSADELNTEKGELGQLQRASIHAYSMALATALRTADPDKKDTRKKLADLYSDFGMRIYSSSRPPFSMGAFSPKELQEKYCCSTAPDGGLYKRRPFRTLRPTQAFRLTYALFAEAVKLNPQSWTSYFMLGKCLWKIHQVTHTDKNETPTLALSALKAFQRAADRLPPRKGQQEPSLEPMYKTVFVVYKLVERGELTKNDAARKIEVIMHQQKQFDASNMPKYDENRPWIDHVIEGLRYLRGVDKARWHHRIAFKAAQLLFCKHEGSDEGAKLAKEYLLDQHLYTAKTLALTVWKPDSERAGRHWIYMTRYARFLCNMLEQTNDLEAIQALARRVRKKTNEFYDHARLWEHVCAAHLNAYRRHGDIPSNGEDGLTKTVTLEEFNPQASRIDAWTSSLENSHPLLDVLREVSELKKLNGQLFKTNMIDDLLVDTWSAIFLRIGPTLPRLSSESQKPSALSAAPSNVPAPASAVESSKQGPAPMKIFQFPGSSSTAFNNSFPTEANSKTPNDAIAGPTNNKDPSKTADGEPTAPNAAAAGSSRTRIANKFVSKRDLLKHAIDAANARAALSSSSNNNSGSGSAGKAAQSQQDRKGSNAEGAANTNNDGASKANGPSKTATEANGPSSSIRKSEPPTNRLEPRVVIPAPKQQPEWPPLYPPGTNLEDEADDAATSSDKKLVAHEPQPDTSSELSELDEVDEVDPPDEEAEGEGNDGDNEEDEEEANDGGSEGEDEEEEQEEEVAEEKKPMKFTSSPSLPKKPVMFPNLRRRAEENANSASKGESESPAVERKEDTPGDVDMDLQEQDSDETRGGSPPPMLQSAAPKVEEPPEAVDEGPGHERRGSEGRMEDLMVID